VVENIKKGIFTYIGDGNNPITVVYSENLIQSLILAARAPKSAGELYMITDGESITRRQLVELLCEKLNMEKPKRSIPYPVAKVLCSVLELLAKVTKQQGPPLLNRFRLKFLHTHLTYNISKAKRELGYEPIPLRQGLEKTIEWYKTI
jgi:nucleoside-diphosphate-sugar epimerase